MSFSPFTTLRGLRTGQRVLLSFAVVLVILCAITAIAVTRLAAVKSLADELVDGALARQQIVTDLLGVVELNGTRALALAKSDSLELSDYFEAQIAEGDKRIAALELRLLPAERERAGALAAAYRALRAEAFRLKGIGKTMEVEKLVDASLLPAQAAWAAELRRQLETEKANAAARAAAAGEVYRDSRLLLIGLGLCAIVGAMFLALRLTLSLVRPLEQAVAHAARVAEGDLSGHLPVTRSDEIGALQRALAAMSEQLGATVARVRTAADGIDATAHTLLRDNDDLAARTTVQAGALEQTTAAMRSLAEAVGRNADCAQRADALAEANAQLAGQGGEDIARAASTMEHVKKSSARIADIVGVMDGIAFQTNILALNAAVEAARSGEHGRGFAVVATEVRTLAQRSANAAKEIKALIAASVGQIDEGADYVRLAAQTMREIVVSSHQVAEGVREITGASQQQGRGIEAVAQAIRQIDHATQQNALLVEEAAHAAHELQEASQALGAAMAFFAGGLAAAEENSSATVLRLVSSLSQASGATPAVSPAAVRAAAAG